MRCIIVCITLCCCTTTCFCLLSVDLESIVAVVPSKTANQSIKPFPQCLQSSGSLLLKLNGEPGQCIHGRTSSLQCQQIAGPETYISMSVAPLSVEVLVVFLRSLCVFYYSLTHACVPRFIIASSILRIKISTTD